MARSTAWKDLEREVARRLGGKRNLKRSLNWAAEDDDVTVEDFPWKIDCKYRTRPWKHHFYLREIRAKYCKGGEAPLLVTKNKGEHGAYVTMELKDFAGLITAFRVLRDECVANCGESHDGKDSEGGEETGS